MGTWKISMIGGSGLYQLDRLENQQWVHVLRFAANLPAHRAPSPIDHVLDAAIVTEAARRDPQLMAKLDAVAERFC